jgi:hypothetical protein
VLSTLLHGRTKNILQRRQHVLLLRGGGAHVIDGFLQREQARMTIPFLLLSFCRWIDACIIAGSTLAVLAAGFGFTAAAVAAAAAALTGVTTVLATALAIALVDAAL